MSAALLAVLPLLASAPLVPDAPHVCDHCAEWNEPRSPFRIFGNSWYVGTRRLASVLITSKSGHILIDGALTQSAPQIAANIERLGFELGDVKLILNSHTHNDHAGGIAALQRASGARVAASPASKRALERGSLTEDDPQFALPAAEKDFPAVANVRAVADGETLRVGPLRITAHFTPGHTPGGTTWTWQSCEEGKCLALVFADSLNAVSAAGFRFTSDPAHPDRVQEFERSIAMVEALDCNLLIVPHPEQADLDAQLGANKKQPMEKWFGDPRACRRYAAAARARLDARVADERGTATPP